MADKPFPTNEADLNLLLQTFKAKLPLHATALGLTPAEVTTESEDADNFNYVITMAPQVMDAKDAYFAFKDLLIDGEISTVQPPMPTFPTVTTPQHPFPGIKKRTRMLIKRIKASPGYTTQIGEDLGLIENDQQGFNPNELFAELKLRAMSDSRVEITFSKQGQDAMQVTFRRKGDTAWTAAGTYTSSPAVHTAPPTVPGDPESREYRGILVKKNDPIGNMSPSYNIVTTP